MAKPKTKGKAELTVSQLKELSEALGDDLDLAKFFTHWLSNGQNATEAYIATKPDVSSRAVAAVMGSRWLSRIDAPIALSIYNLGIDRYLKKIDEGLEAKQDKVMTTKSGNTIDMSGPDWEVRQYFHEKLGRLLGVAAEEKAATGLTLNLNQQINQSVDGDRKTYG